MSWLRFGRRSNGVTLIVVPAPSNGTLSLNRPAVDFGGNTETPSLCDLILKHRRGYWL
jgi:hypothetical protein